MSRSIIILSGVLMFSLTCRAQYSGDRLYGPRFGIDLSRIPMHFLVPQRSDVELNADLQLSPDLFAVAEGGWNKTEINNKPTFGYNSSGYFGRVGVDYNFLKPTYRHESTIVYGGIRYGLATMNYAIPQYQITDTVWGNVNGSFPQKALTAQWIELVAGMKVEVLRNLFLGWSLRTRMLISKNFGAVVRPYIIPGYGQGNNNAVFDFNYTISYKIPLWKGKEPRPKQKKENAPPGNKAAANKAQSPAGKAPARKPGS